jgi:hypothetical protein
MLTELRKRKLTVLFHHHDADDEGFPGKPD